jgi:hypothetical protein
VVGDFRYIEFDVFLRRQVQSLSYSDLGNMSVPVPKAPVLDLNNTVGAMEIGVLVSTFLFGVISCQGAPLNFFSLFLVLTRSILFSMGVLSQISKGCLSFKATCKPFDLVLTIFVHVDMTGCSNMVGWRISRVIVLETNTSYRLMELGHTISVSHSLYTITVIDQDSPFKLLSAPKSLDTSILFSAFIGTRFS